MARLGSTFALFIALLLVFAGIWSLESCGSSAGLLAWSGSDTPAADRVAMDDEEDGGGGGGSGCIECHPAPPEDPTLAWNDAPGDHDQCGECHIGDHGNKPVPPSSICLNCHQEKWAEKHNATATVCLQCHLWPHVPLKIELKPGIHKKHKEKGVQCSSCHKMMGGIIPPRAKCLACHTNSNETKHSRGALCSICHKS